MKQNLKLAVLIAILTAFCLLGEGCSSNESTADRDSLSVDIVVPYATATPIPEDVANSQSQPITISANGDVTLNDKSWIDSGFAPAEMEEAENYYTQLRLGDSGVEVRNLQTRLKELYYYKGEVSGVFDSATEDAVKLFELSYGSMQTGIATARLQTLLFSDNAVEYNSNAYIASSSGSYTSLEYGSTGPAVYALQERLQELGYPVWDINGIYDDQTAAAVRMFYQAYDTEESVSASVAFQQELYSENARRNKSALNVTFREGYMGSAVTEIQQALIDLGYLSGTPSSSYDEETVAAVKALQSSLGLDKTGDVNPGLYKLLVEGESASEEDLANGITLNGTMRQGSKGEKVMQLQRRLIELGYPDVMVTGTFDDATAHAVSLFQGLAELRQTGTASKALQEFILSDNAGIFRMTEDLLDSTSVVDEATVVYKPGDSGEGVVELQSRLHTLGYFNSAINGEYDSHTENAVKTLQGAISVDQTGVVNATMLLYVFSNAAPRSGIVLYEDVAPRFTRLSLDDKGDEVTELQRRLWELGFLTSAGVENSIGAYNAATQEAVIRAQKAMGYQETDGIAGVEFQAFIFSKYGERLTSND